MADSIVTPDLLQSLIPQQQPSQMGNPVGGLTPTPNMPPRDPNVQLQQGGPLKQGLRGTLMRILHNTMTGGIPAAMYPGDIMGEAMQRRQQALAMQQVQMRLEAAQASEAQARAQDFSTQAQARQLALQPVRVPDHIASEFGLDPGTQVPAGQLHEMAHTFYSMRASGKMEEPEAAFERRQKWGAQMGLNPDELKTYALTGQLPKPEKSATATDLESRYIDWIARRKQGLPTSPAEDAWASGYAANKTLNTTTKISLGAGEKNTARADRSYQFNTAQLDKLASPLEERTARLLRLEDTINQQTPQADALIAPELLTVMAGGQGSGLRMNEAEIARIVGGRTNWESLQAAVNKWRVDPSKGLSVTPAQRDQIRSLLGVVRDRVNQKQAILDQARQALINTDDLAEHRKIVANAHSALSAVDQGTPEFGSNIPPKVRDMMNKSRGAQSAPAQGTSPLDAFWK